MINTEHEQFNHHHQQRACLGRCCSMELSWRRQLHTGALNTFDLILYHHHCHRHCHHHHHHYCHHNFHHYQAGIFYNKTLNEAERFRLADNIASHLCNAQEFIQVCLCVFFVSYFDNFLLEHLLKQAISHECCHHQSSSFCKSTVGDEISLLHYSTSPNLWNMDSITDVQLFRWITQTLQTLTRLQFQTIS